MKKIYLCFLPGLMLVLALRLNAQKKPLGIDDIESWNRITETVISPDGNWIAYKTEPWKGDSRIYLYNKNGKKKFEADCGKDIIMTDDSRFMVFTIEPAYEYVRELKLKKTKKSDMPGDVLGIYTISSDKLDLIKNIKNYKIPEMWANWLAYQVDKPGDEAIEQNNHKKESGKNGFILSLRNLENGEIISWPFVTEYCFAGKAKKMFFVSTGDDDFKAGIYLHNLESGKTVPVMTGRKEYRQITPFETGNLLAFLLRPEGNSEPRVFGLYLWTGKGSAEEIAGNEIRGIPENWKISENGRISFSADGVRIFFGTAPVHPERDTTIQDEEYPGLDIWHGSEVILHTEQLANLERDLKKTYLAMYDRDDKRVVQIETEDIPQSHLLDKGNAGHVLLLFSKPYELQSMWDPIHYDIYLLNLATGEKQVIKKDMNAIIEASPGGKYLVWFNYPDYSYYTYHIASGKEYRITEPGIIRADWETNTTFDTNEPYGLPGWMKDDRAVLIYDRYDIWKVDPENKTRPVNLTTNGRKKKTVYRLIRFDHTEDFIDEYKIQYLTGTGENSRSSGYYRCGLSNATEPELLLEGDYYLSVPLKADDSETIVYTKETFNVFPDLLVSDLKFRNRTRISDANPQQDDFLWGTAEIYEWTSLEGHKHKGLLFKPEGFDPSRQYPMIVQFFHKSSDQLFNHRTPECGRSSIDYHYYVSNGYVIFNPDIYFEDGYIGESAYKSLVPGVTALVNDGFIDPENIGIQGHSYSGYQIAYILTRTNMFACAEAGAPVVNFFSAYGGIRWTTGKNRAFQYEHHQALGSIWEVPLRFFENSPIFFMDKVTTPVLILHNDNDGAVPWYQGIEYFIALRRLQKPVWLLNYNGEGHGLVKPENRRDFQIRMAQFFDHYLKGAPMPEWMHDGIPAVDKDHNLGYDLIR
jgi:dipeptidyl aminopeptidase/acylaminoacyl peptidase